MKDYTTASCVGTHADTFDLYSGVVSNWYLLRCWCETANAPEGDDALYDMQIMNRFSPPGP